MKLKGIRTIGLLVAAVILVIGSVAGLAAVAGDSSGDQTFKEGFGSEEVWRMDARYWWEALPISPHHQQQAREVGVLIFDRYFGIDISTMSPQELDELWDDVIGHENQEKAERLFFQYATEKGFEIPGMPAPREEFVAPPDATYWWEFIDPELRDGAITMAKIEFPEKLRSYWECADWKGIELPIPRPEELCIMTLTLEEYEQILAPPRFPLGRVGIEEWMERFYPRTIIIAVFGRGRTYDDPTRWFDRLLEASNLIPLFPLLVTEFGAIAKGVSASGYIIVELDPDKAVEEAEAIAAKIYALIAPKAEKVGIDDVPVIFVQRWLYRLRLAIDFKDPRLFNTTHLPLAQGFRPVPGGAQVARGDGAVATIGFPLRDPIYWWDDVDLSTTGHLVPIINTPLYQPAPPPQPPPYPYRIGTIADTGSFGGRADVARIATPDGDVIPYVRTATNHTAPILGWRDPVLNEWSGKFGRTTGRTSGRIRTVGVELWNETFGWLQDQVTAYIVARGGDSGAPLFVFGPGAGMTVTGIAWGYCDVHNVSAYSAVSGVMHELPGWYPYTR